MAISEAQIQAKAIIAAALLSRVDSDVVGQMDLSQLGTRDAALRGLRERVDRIYEAIATDKR